MGNTKAVTLYLAITEDGSVMKIGRTSNVHARLKGLNTFALAVLGCKVRIIRTAMGVKEDELALKRALGISREWFPYRPDAEQVFDQYPKAEIADPPTNQKGYPVSHCARSGRVKAMQCIQTVQDHRSRRWRRCQRKAQRGATLCPWHIQKEGTNAKKVRKSGSRDNSPGDAK
jgi:hypothetical protein